MKMERPAKVHFSPGRGRRAGSTIAVKLAIHDRRDGYEPLARID
jgi:hypothetical protein